MASYWAVAVAAFSQIFLRISFFIEQSSDACSTAPTLASWIFLIAFLDILLDICVYPVRYMHLPYICQILAESIIVIFLTEFGTLVVWCKIEKITCKLSKYILLLAGMLPDFYNSWESYILGIVTTAVSLTLLLFVAQATDHLHFVRKRSVRLCRKITSKSLEVWNKLHSVLAIAKRSTHCEPVSNYSAAEIFDMGGEICNIRRNARKRSHSRTKGSRSRNSSRSRR